MSESYLCASMSALVCDAKALFILLYWLFIVYALAFVINVLLLENAERSCRYKCQFLVNEENMTSMPDDVEKMSVATV